jgi:YesN/AraC family two-component response regulator
MASRRSLQYSLNPGYYDILMTDHHMPNVNGLELVEHLRKNGFEGKIVVMSGSLTPELMQAYLNRRVHKILQKPFSYEILASTLGDVLTQWHAEHGGAPGNL